MIFVILWEFRVRKGKEKAFEELYGAKGAWARFFSRSKDFRGTELLRDASTKGRYLTIDRWTSAEAFDTFRRTNAALYQQIDVRCEGLTESEAPLGTWIAQG